MDGRTNALFLIVASVVIGGTAFLSGLVPLARRWSDRRLRAFIAFGAGTLLGAAFLHMLPDAQALLGARVGALTLAGFLLLYVLERFVMVHACEEQACDFHTVGIAALIGMSVHSLVSGLSLGASLLVPPLAVVVALALVIHKVPEGFCLATMLVRGSYPRGRVVAFLFVYALMVPLGAALAYFALHEVTEAAVGAAVALSAGTFFHIAVSDLLPEVHRARSGRPANLAAFFAGVGLMAVSRLLGG